MSLTGQGKYLNSFSFFISLTYLEILIFHLMHLSWFWAAKFREKMNLRRTKFSFRSAHCLQQMMYSSLGGRYLLQISSDIHWCRIFDKKNPKFWYLLNPFSWCRNRKPRGNSHLGDYLSGKRFPDHRESEKRGRIETLRQLIVSRGDSAITWLYPEVSIHPVFPFRYNYLPDVAINNTSITFVILLGQIATLDILYLGVKDVEITSKWWRVHFDQRSVLEHSWLFYSVQKLYSLN